MRTSGFIVVIESFLIRKGVVSLLHRIPGVRVIHEFDALEPFQRFIGKSSGHWIVIGDSLFEKAEKIFQSHPDLLESTVLLREDPLKKVETEIHSIYLSDTKEEIVQKIRTLLDTGFTDPRDPPSDILTQREKTIVRLVSLGLTNRQIAQQLYLSTHTVITHRKNISSKLGIKSVSGLTVYAIVNNIITIEEVTSKP